MIQVEREVYEAVLRNSLKVNILEAENGKLKSDLNNVLSLLLKTSPAHEGYVRANFPEFYKEQDNVWFE
jgi:hypothetical protein